MVQHYIGRCMCKSIHDHNFPTQFDDSEACMLQCIWHLAVLMYAPKSHSLLRNDCMQILHNLGRKYSFRCTWWSTMGSWVVCASVLKTILPNYLAVRRASVHFAVMVTLMYPPQSNSTWKWLHDTVYFHMTSYVPSLDMYGKIVCGKGR